MLHEFHPQCTPYCYDGIHCIETLAHPSLTADFIAAHYARTHLSEEVVSIRRALEIPLTQWREADAALHGRSPLPWLTEGWLIFTRLKETDDVAS